MRKSLPLLIIVVLMASMVPSSAAPEWQEEFNELCSMVQVAGSLTREEIQGLIERVDLLMPRIEASEDPSKKVYLFRLKKCRDFFEFTLKSQ